MATSGCAGMLVSVVASMSMLAGTAARAQPLGASPTAAARFVDHEILVFPKDPGEGEFLAEELKQQGYLVIGVAPVSGMVLAVVPVMMAGCGLEDAFCDVLEMRADVRAAERNVGGSVGSRQPVCQATIPAHVPGTAHNNIPRVCPPVTGVYPPGVPTDPGFCYQWWLENIGQTLVDRTCVDFNGNGTCWPQFATEGIDIDLVEAWKRTQGSPNIAVAILDTGVDYANEDFDPNRFLEPDIPLVCAGFAHHTLYPCCAPNCVFGPASDGDGHGTVCASIIGSVANDGKGIAGIDQHCKILSATTVGGEQAYDMNFGRVLIALGRIATWPQYDSVRVINMSIGLLCSTAGENMNQNGALADVTELLKAQDRYIVSISQNYGVGGALTYCPNNFSNVFTVGGVDGRGWRFQTPCGYTSGTGSPLDFMAPGFAMFTARAQSDPWPGAPYTTVMPTLKFSRNSDAGTSWAAPVVSGVISLVLARAEFLGILNDWSDITWDEMYEILRASAIDQPSHYDHTQGDPLDAPGRDDYYGHGMVNAHRALLALERLHYHCRADRTANNNPGAPGYGIPDAQVTVDDWNYFFSRLPSLDVLACDVTGLGFGALGPGAGAPDGLVTAEDQSYFVAFYNAYMANCLSVPCPSCP